ncbi:MAG: hypothetical protein AAF223_18195 [Bacteroidota bacterium]
MRHISVIIILASFALACQEDDEGNPSFLLEEGTYTGVFYRSSPNARWASANVTLTLENGRFSGSSDRDKYPAICEGTYQLIGIDQVTFENSCVWTADFDWSFILDGEYQITDRDDKIVICREYEGQVSDTYELKRD